MGTKSKEMRVDTPVLCVLLIHYFKIEYQSCIRTYSLVWVMRGYNEWHGCANLISDLRYPIADIRSIYDRKSDIAQMGFQKIAQP